LQDVSQFYNSFQGATSALEKISGVLEEEPSVSEPTAPLTLPTAASGRRVQFESVRFGYRPAGSRQQESPAGLRQQVNTAGLRQQVNTAGSRQQVNTAIVLPGLDLDIPAGQTVALVGETGAGKTTIARLLARFYDPNAGRVLLDGVDLRDLPDQVLRREVVLITQESFLFEGTVAENIRLGRPRASDAEVEAAARAIGAHEFIAGLPGGYATKVGKRGGRLSAGQRQLISFARAFIAAPGVLVLDEATALLDIPSERLVQAALQTVLAGRTAVIIAHRLSTVAIANRVLVLRAGQIIEDGSPADLLGGNGEYADLHARWAASLA
jgi:ABC-type multidrug transport system fused ATPase/permease subunit